MPHRLRPADGILAERHDPASVERQIVAVGRLVKSHTTEEAELAVIVSDGFQRRGMEARSFAS